jgi:uncharacterized protein YjbJ (UPF0337 family)
MNTDILKGKWNQLKGGIRSKWADLTDDDIGKIQGDSEKFIGVLQEKYGYSRDQAEREVDDFLNTSSTGAVNPGDKQRRVS